MVKFYITRLGSGGIGFFVGGFIGYLARPSAFLVGQLSFEQVISRGSNFEGVEQLLVPIAQKSFSITLIGAIVGTGIGLIIHYLVGKKNAK